MGTQNLLDEKHITNAFVHMEGEKLEIVSLSLEQEFGMHHQFKVVLDYDVLQKGFLANPADQIALIGKTLDIDLQQGNDSGGAYEFRGVITNVFTEGKEGKHGYIVMEGSSPTVLLERGKRLDVFADMSLQQVFEEVTTDIKNNRLSKVNKPVYNVPVSFLMQYYESDWEFLQRLSAISGETLFYTGRDLVFGEYKDWAAIEVMYDREITNIQFGSRLLANTFTHYQYLLGKDEIIQQESSETIENSNNFLNLAAQKGKELIKSRPVVVPSPLNVEDKGALDEIAEKRKTETAARTIYVRGVAKTSAPRIGRLLTILMPDGLSTNSQLGTYRIIKVSHVIDENHHYHCEFEGISSSLKYFPTPELKMPVVSSIMGIVIKNTDPEGLGRVKVEFPFAKDRVSNTWLRVMTPNAGSSQNVSKNRGMVFIPEEGDQVMVGFEFGDPNRPYVMGSMFHGLNTEGGKEDNHIKSIITRSGHTIEFDDADSSLGITIKDKSGNVIHLDTKGESIEIVAPETMAFSAKNMTFTASENIFMKVGENLEAVINNKFNMKSNEIVTVVKECMQETAKEYELTSQKIRLDSTKENMELASSKTIDIQSSEKVQLF